VVGVTDSIVVVVVGVVVVQTLAVLVMGVVVSDIIMLLVGIVVMDQTSCVAPRVMVVAVA
jgi:hypothetical protein